MTPVKMREAVGELPDEYLSNYVESFDIGMVGSFTNPFRCVACCMASPPTERRDRDRLDGLRRSRQLVHAQRIEDAYAKCKGRDNEAAFRTRLYDTCVEALADRASRRNSVVLPAPLNCAVREPELVTTP